MACIQLTAFGVDVKKALTDKRMTQTELAEELGVQKAYVTHILPIRKSGAKYIRKICELLDLAPSWCGKNIA